MPRVGNHNENIQTSSFLSLVQGEDLRFSTMAMFLSSILSELTSRSISFLIDKCLRQTSPIIVEETLSNLQRLLLRVQVIVEEADEQHISNHAILRQLSQIRKEMYRGYHSLDTFRCPGAHEVSSFDVPQNCVVTDG